MGTNKKVSDRLLCIWSKIIEISKFWKSLPKRKPSGKSFENVKIAVEQNSMLSYLYTDLVDLFRLVLKLIIKDEVVENCRSGNQLTKIDFESGNVFKKNRDVTITFSTESNLSNLKKKDQMKDSNMQNIYDNVRKFVVSTIKKMSGRCPLQSAVARNAVIFNPEIMLENTKEIFRRNSNLYCSTLFHCA